MLHVDIKCFCFDCDGVSKLCSSAGTFLFHKDECRFGLSDTNIRQRHYPHVSLVPNGVGRYRLCQILHLRSLRSFVAMQWNVHEPSRKLHFVVVVQIRSFNILLP